jgi:hypothetical protein
VPNFGGGHAMNPAVAKRKAAESSDDGQQDDLIPDGHELESMRIEPAENGFTVTHHTRPKPGTKAKGGKQAEPSFDYRGKARVFEDEGRAAGHVMKVMSAHRKAKRSK